MIATYDDDQLYCLQTTNVLNLKPDYQSQISLKYLLALINSSLLNWFFRISFPSNNHIASNQLARLPIRVIDKEKDEDISAHNKLVSFVEKILDLNIKMDSASIPREKEMFNRQIDVVDNQIDKIVFSLYGLAEEEIALVKSDVY